MTETDRQSANSGTKAPDAALSLPEGRLSAWFEHYVQGFEGPLSTSQFKGGQSNPTYLLTTPAKRYVLRRKPPGPLLPSAHAVEREFRVMQALGLQGFPVPKVYGLCEDETVIGSVFFVMEHIDGRIIWEPFIPDATPADRTAIFDAMNMVMAQLHTLDPYENGLGDYGRPSDYLKRQVSRWTRQYRASETETIPAMEMLIEWLPDNLPQEQPARLVHGDFRLDNLILAPDENRVAAVLDWELSTLGDPIADFTYHCMQWVMPRTPDGSGIGTLAGHDLTQMGIPSLVDYVERYEARTGYTVHEHLDFYFAFNFFRLAAILQGIAGRLRDGTATSGHARSMASQTGAIAETGRYFAEQPNKQASNL
ncbi:phosphotransferase family protein [Roseibium sp.]|uniref:phosphotransferase family protein n=1 Tax=Roseibium sp. TaxID=1936156 RepID=UPI003A975842